MTKRGSIIQKPYIRAAWIIIAVLLTWKCALFFYFPSPNADGPWSLSHTFSILQGHFFESNFAHAYIEFYNMPYMYGLLNAPFYRIFMHTPFLLYSIFFWNVIWILLTLFIASRLLGKAGDNGLRFLLFAVSFLLSSYTYSLRPEMFIFPFLFLLQYILDKYKITNRSGWMVALIAGVIGLIHPVGGFYAVFFVAIFCWEYRLGVKKFIGLLLGIGTAVIVLYGPIILINIDLWKLNFFQRGFENDTRHLDFTYPVKFFTYSMPLFVTVLIYIFSPGTKSIVKEIIYLLCCIGLFLLFERSYYFPYLFHFVLWRLTINRDYVIPVFFKVCFVGAAFIGLVVCYILPTYQFSENKDYVQTFKKSLDFSAQVAISNPGKLVWLPSNMSMKIIDRDNARLYTSYYESLIGAKPEFDPSSIYLVEMRGDLETVTHYKTNSDDSIIVKQIYEPVKGLARLALHGERSDSLGLWMITCTKKLSR